MHLQPATLLLLLEIYKTIVPRTKYPVRIKNPDVNTCKLQTKMFECDNSHLLYDYCTTIYLIGLYCCLVCLLHALVEAVSDNYWKYVKAQVLRGRF